ncbi:MULTISPECIES: PfkB family carbohydrate kinase [unclassified Actinopolyspora]|uniref:PfkB family carbohydrate kinase n=1 Tax=unclassified Actinopolyspora TaxID=2639451 RepID=UPI0013F68607|nr:MULTISPECIES: PfkB family carbohydrate kinase [unclassified Actinopolyspora]NHD17600.1 sugar kinase [Actinopolyspora sp. BKK2]NHE76667.1 sugar kinase [Actinopolyspora sp. BKK1]
MDYDVIVLGEVLLEVGTSAVFRDGVQARLGCSGDALNAAAAAAAAGARVGLLTRIGDDEVGEGILARVEELGVDTGLIERTGGHNGCYLMRADPGGTRGFAYMRRGSAASGLSPDDVRRARLGERARFVLTSGITAALSDTARAAVLAAKEAAGQFVYDPNHRPALVGAEEAAATLRAVADGARLVTPSHPGEASALLGCDTPEGAARELRALGAEAVAVTRGDDGVLVEEGARDGSWSLPPVPAPNVVDQTGAGDVFAGTVTARLALGDELPAAAGLATAAASLSVGGRGGTGGIPTIGSTREHLATSSGSVSWAG